MFWYFLSTLHRLVSFVRLGYSKDSVPREERDNVSQRSPNNQTQPDSTI